jgi:hypothetical protein
MNREEHHKRRRDAGILQVTERDLLALSFTGQQYCLTFDHLQILLAHYSPTVDIDTLSVGATRNALERWLQLGYIEPPRKTLRGYPVTIWLSRKGLKDLNIPYPYYLPNPSSIPHFYAVNAVRLHLHQFDTPTQWIPQRTLTKDTTLRPLPDAELHLPFLAPIALIVLECLTSSMTIPNEINTLTQLAERRTNDHQPAYARFWYFVHHSVFAPFQAALNALDPQVHQRVVLYQLESDQRNHPQIQTSSSVVIPGESSPTFPP